MPIWTRRDIARALGALPLSILAPACSKADTHPADNKSGGPHPHQGASADKGAAADKGDKPRIALVMKSLANEFFQTMEQGARDHQKAHAAAYDLLANGIKDEQDVGRQVEIIEQMVAQKVAAIVLAPADSKALVSACKKAQDAGVVVVNIDNKLDAQVLADKKITVPFVGPDNRKGARAVGEYLAKRLKAGDKVATIDGAPTAENGAQRKLGFEDAMKAAGIVVAASQTANWETAQASRVAAAMLTAHPDLKALLCGNDSMALGAVAALREANRKDAVLVVGFDNIRAVQELIKSGKVLATADQHGDKLAAYGIDNALKILREKAAPSDQETPVDLVTQESLK
jgi:ribose transport system substrate-binding protein